MGREDIETTARHQPCPALRIYNYLVARTRNTSGPKDLKAVEGFNVPIGGSDGVGWAEGIVIWIN